MIQDCPHIFHNHKDILVAVHMNIQWEKYGIAWKMLLCGTYLCQPFHRARTLHLHLWLFQNFCPLGRLSSHSVPLWREKTNTIKLSNSVTHASMKSKRPQNLMPHFTHNILSIYFYFFHNGKCSKWNSCSTFFHSDHLGLKRTGTVIIIIPALTFIVDGQGGDGWHDTCDLSVGIWQEDLETEPHHIQVDVGWCMVKTSCKK